MPSPSEQLGFFPDEPAGPRPVLPDFVEQMREIARELSRKHGHVTSDDLRDWADAHGYRAPDPHAWGAIFNAPFDHVWQVVGMMPSTRRSNNGRSIRMWRYVGP